MTASNRRRTIVAVGLVVVVCLYVRSVIVDRGPDQARLPAPP